MSYLNPEDRVWIDAVSDAFLRTDDRNGWRRAFSEYWHAKDLGSSGNWDYHSIKREAEEFLRGGGNGYYKPW